MKGKELKVTELELKFGETARKVNVFGVFKYKPTNNLYVIYADVDTTYDYVCYGTSHIKNDTILSMSSNKEEDIEVIKEYIFKVTNDEPLDNFEVISLDNINEIEIIASKNFEIKEEVLTKLVDKTIPKKETDDNTKTNNKVKKKKSPIKSILLFFFIIILAGAGYIFYTAKTESEKISKVIYCKKSYSHDELKNVTVEEEKEYQFNNYDKLEKVDVTTRFNFNNENDYLEFINNLTYYKYMPKSDDPNGSYKIDDENRRFVTFNKIDIDESYQEPTDYEEVLFFNSKNNYKCEEKIEK